MIGVTQNKLALHLGPPVHVGCSSSNPHVFQVFELGCEQGLFYGCLKWQRNNSSHETNIVMSKNWDKGITSAVKAARGSGKNVSFPTAHESFT